MPDWQLPPGVSRGSWDYAQSRPVADDYDAYHAGNPLFGLEAQLLRDTFGQPPRDRRGVIADLGCGSGRALLPLAELGWGGLAIDLSDAMLDVVRRKAKEAELPIDCVRANLVELGPEAVADASVDHAMCLFSTLGMIRGRENRALALANVRRVLRPGGRFVLHAHNLWFNLRDPGGPRWLVRGLAGTVLPALRPPGCDELGDKVYLYRGVPNFFLHVFRKSELRHDLARAGFVVRRWMPLDLNRQRELRWPQVAQSLRAGGWLIVCEAA